MRQRKTLTCIWFAFFLGALLIVELYFWHTVEVGGQRAPIALSSGRAAIYGTVISIYGPIIGAIIAFWFARPFKPAPSGAHDAFRYKLALGSTALFNVVVLAMLARYHFAQSGMLEDATASAKTMAWALAFLITWPNYFYFGSKIPQGRNEG